MGYRLSKIYTRTGDDGSTSIDGKKRVAKNEIRVEILGTLDELNCAIGCVLSELNIAADVYHCLDQVQHALFDIGGTLCLRDKLLITQDHIEHLEKTIDEWNLTLSPLKEFLLPRGTRASAACHLARAICRRAERHLVALHQEEKIAPEILCYINRLSDVLFVAARMLAKEENIPETLWNHL
ncbi:MAG: hypothetical protein ACD_60C00143G0001 [uncultured bacterium]|nr:MAG: hypothetical protein ACD_60C00143G0001 [uncultured bacterium]